MVGELAVVVVAAILVSAISIRMIVSAVTVGVAEE